MSSLLRWTKIRLSVSNSSNILENLQDYNQSQTNSNTILSFQITFSKPSKYRANNLLKLLVFVTCDQ